MGGVDIDETSPSILAVFRSIGFSERRQQPVEI
jgi:hypothetical protein